MGMIGIRYSNARCEDCPHKKLKLGETVIEDYMWPRAIRREYYLECEHEDVCEMWIQRLMEIHDSYNVDPLKYTIKAEEVE